MSFFYCIKKFPIVVFFTLLSLIGKGQVDDSVFYSEKSLQIHRLFLEIKKASDFKTRALFNDSVIAVFDSILSCKESFFYGFDSLNTIITCMQSDDKLWRLINWNIPHDDGTHSYFGYTQYYIKNKDTLITTKLTNTKNTVVNPEQQTLSFDNWYGTLYYEIIPTQIGKKERIYVLLGWDGYKLLATRKIIDVVSFNEGVPVFGKAVFSMQHGLQKRIIFTYNHRVNMKLRWDNITGLIIYDNLEPIAGISPNVEGFLAPSLIFDGLKWNGDIWEYQNDVEVIVPDGKKKIRHKKYPY